MPFKPATNALEIHDILFIRKAGCEWCKPNLGEPTLATTRIPGPHFHGSQVIDDGTLCRSASPLPGLHVDIPNKTIKERVKYFGTIDFIGSTAQDIYTTLQDRGFGIPIDFAKNTIAKIVGPAIQSIHRDCVEGASVLQCVNTASLETGLAILNAVDPETYFEGLLDTLVEHDVVTTAGAEEISREFKQIAAFRDAYKLGSLVGQLNSAVKKLPTARVRKDGGLDRRTAPVKKVEKVMYETTLQSGEHIAKDQGEKARRVP